MKKFFSTLVAVALTLALSTSLVSCGDDDNDDPTPPATQKTIKDVTLSSALYVNQAILDTYDIAVTDAQGQQLTFSTTPVDMSVADGVTAPMYAVQVNGSSTKLPLEVDMYVKFTVKAGYTLPEKSDFALVTWAKGIVTYTDGTSDIYGPKAYTHYNKGVAAANIEGYTQSLNKLYGHIEAELEEDGLDF